MSSIKDHVVGVAKSLDLKAKGVPQDSLFYWVLFGDKWRINGRTVADAEFKGTHETASAFLSSELGALLPSHFNLSYKAESRDSTLRSSIDCYDSKGKNGETWKLYPKRVNEADDKAHMIDFLLGEGHITIDHENL